MKRVWHVLASLAVVAVRVGPASAQTLFGSSDTYLRGGAANANQGSAPLLRIQSSGPNRALVRFAEAEVVQAVGTGTLVSATLQVFIQSNRNNWGTGRAVDVHRLTADWAEAGATWNCGIDTSHANSRPNCASQWDGGSFAPSPTATVLHTNRQTGWIQFDITADVRAFLTGTANYGWVIKKTAEGQNGEVAYSSREGTAGQGPRLVLVVENPTADAVPPAVRVTAPDPPVVFNNLTPTIAVEYADNGTGVDLATLHVLVDGADVVTGCAKGVAAATCAPPALSAGAHQVQLQLSDHAGNVGTASYQFQIFLGAGPHTLTLDAAADTYVKEGAPNQNQDKETILRVRDAGNNRALVRFDQAQMAALIGSQSLVSATLELYVQTNGNNWGSTGRTVDANRTAVPWAEALATWNCASDSDLSNSRPDCPGEWNGGSYVSPATASVLQTKGLLGRVQWDVSRDVAAFLSGTPNYGWVIKKTNEAQPGLVEYTSREGASGQRPRLVLVVKASAPIVSVGGVTDGQVSNTDLTITYSATGDTALSVSATLSKDGQAAAPFASGTTLGEDGAYALTVTASDLAGNTATATRSFVIDKTPPTITVSQTPTPNAAGWNNGNVTVSFSCADALSGVAVCASPVIVTQEGGGQVVTGTATDRAGNPASTFATVSLDRTPPAVSIASPVEGTFQRVGRVQVSGTVADANPITSLSVNGTAFDPGTSFSGDVQLQAGAQSLVATAQDVAGNVGAASVSVTYQPQPAVKITSPANLAAFGTSPITVSGTVDNPAVTVTVGVERVPAAVSGTSFTATGVHLQEGGNVLTAVAADAQGGVGTDSITVVRDTVAPRVLIDSPVNGTVTAAASVAVSGRVNDVVLGTINSGQAQVTVNGIPASVSNRTFVAQGVALEEGTNTITAVAKDAVGNFDTKTITVVRQAFTALSLTAVSGDQQQAGIGETLVAPLVVEVKEAGGNPVPGRSLTFRALENSGEIADAEGHRGRALVLTTDAQGRGQVRFTLGSRAGVGNNRVEVNLVPLMTDAVLTVPPVVFIASGASHAPAKINLDSGGSQKGIVDQALPRPFVAVVTDEGHNRLGNVPVTFTVVEGGGNLAGASSVTFETDSDGRALTVLTLGPDPGIQNNTVTASVADLSGLPAVFKASAFEPGDPASTRISGVVLDNSNLPIPGVTLRLRGTALASASDAQGSFTLNGVPVGDVHLVVDGSTAQRPGTWPDLEFEMVTVPGANNTLGMPIYLLPLDTSHAIFVDETHGGTLTLPDYPGFSLTVAPNSATFPDGTRRGTVSVTVVHADKVPMVPNFGQQPRFIVTIQPPGARFDPPARVTHPNVDGLPPGHVTELYSFDHDMGSFVATGTATVSEDGTQLVSDPGTGIIKGGWHCGGDPAAAGTAADCEDCQICDGKSCVADPQAFCRACKKAPGKACDENGSCKQGQDLIPQMCARRMIKRVVYNTPRTIPLELLGATCGAAVQYCVETVEETCAGTDLNGAQLFEEISSDGGCSLDQKPPTLDPATWEIGPDNAVLPGGVQLLPLHELHASDTYALAGPPAAFPNGTCTETYTQRLKVGSCLVQTVRITFTVTRNGSQCSAGPPTRQ